MIQEISNQIEAINKSLAWVRKNKPEQYDQKFIPLIECRKELKKVMRAAINNPGIAAFGKSQVGKSYLISCLLQDNGKPFMVKAGDGEYNFVKDINPPSEEGGGRESTGVVSRFSSFKRRPSAYSRELPVMVNTFSLTDVILILADSYYHDITERSSHSDREVEMLCDSITETYRAKPVIANPVIGADDVLYMKDYFKKHNTEAQSINRSAFFDRVALVIDRVPTSEYVNIFSNLWYKNPNVTNLYNVLYDILRTFDFAQNIYLPIDSVLHHGVKEDTIMSVQCLNQILDDRQAFTTDVYLQEGGQFVKRATGFSKSGICAICSEVIFKIEESFLASKSRYDFSHIAPDVAQRLTHDDIEMEMLRDNDLLDFPGARSRLELKEESVSDKGTLLNCFLRGKVAYLFNKFNEELGINILLYSHHNKDNDVSYLFKLVEEWVNTYVGATPEERRRKLETTEVSPLFYIGTMFNLDMQQGVEKTIPTEPSIHQRWKGRFDTVMNGQCFRRENVDWLKNWTREGENFQNSYMLRDYKFSGPKAGLYQGFQETGREQELIMSEEYYQMMRKTFIEDEYVRQYCADPALSWDVAASMNNDGTLWVMQNLDKVAKRMDKAREQQFQDIIRKNISRVYTLMKEYHVSENADEQLKKNIRKANSIIREMDFTCNEDSYFFGHLIQSLQLTETKSLQVIHDLIQSGELSEKIHDTTNYEIITKRCGDMLKACTNDAERWQVLMDVYALDSQEDAEAFLLKRNVDYKRLFNGNFKKKLNSVIIAEKVYNLWENQIQSPEFMNEMTNNHKFDKDVMADLVNGIVDTSKSLRLEERLGETIAEYVNVVSVFTINESLIADILASTINAFVIDLGYHLLEAGEVDKARQIADKRHLPTFNYIEKERPSTFEEEELTAMFDELTSNPKAMTTAFENNYYSWLEYMFVSFITHLNIPDYDHEANEQLTKILNELT